MHIPTTRLALGASALMHLTAAVPTPTPVELAPRSDPSSLIGDIQSEITALLGTFVSGVDAAAVVLKDLSAVSPTSTPTSYADSSSRLQSIYSAYKGPGSLFASAVALIANGFSPSDIVSAVAAIDVVTGINSPVNFNPKNPWPPIYPFKSFLDAPYDLTEVQLREIIYIPPTFTYGKIKPVILIPGSGSRGGVNYEGNFIKLFTGSSYADPVWINPPAFQLEDAQTAAEYTAYAINYISAISGHKNVTVLGWSQGNIDIQWALKYWRSARSVVSDFIAISPDYHGTVLADIIAPTGFPSTPAIFQQEYNSNFITAMRHNNGDSAYVPTTNVYSAVYDEIVEPQQNPNASAILSDVRKVGVTNNALQTICAGYPSGSGGFFTHEGVLYNNLAFALAKDAITHDGPGQATRLDLASVCSAPVAPGLGLPDVLSTEFTIPLALYGILTYVPKVFVEPGLRFYALLSLLR